MAETEAARARTELMAELDATPGFFNSPELDEQGVESAHDAEDQPDSGDDAEAAAGAKQSDEPKPDQTQSAKDAAKEPRPEDRAKAEWEKIEAEKARLAKERDEIEQARNAPKSTDGYSPEDYEAVAKQFEADGNDELAKQARAKAQEVRQQGVLRTLKSAHAKSIRDAVSKYPDLNNPQSALYQRLDQTLKSRPQLFTYPEGISDAVEACVAYERATRVEALEKEVGALKQALAEKEKLLHPTPGGMSEPSSGEDEFDNLPPSKQRELIKRELRAMESRGVSLFQE